MPKPFLTPPAMPGELECRQLQIPSSREWLGVFNSAILEMSHWWNWEQVNETDLTPEECAAFCYNAYVEYLQSSGCATGVVAPYWEDGESADDVVPADDQHWYGYISEGNFIEDVGVFAISNFLASTLGEKAAVLYATNERKIRLSFFNGGGVPGVIKVYADDILAQTVNLTGDADEIIDVDVITGYVDEAVEILQVLDSV